MSNKIFKPRVIPNGWELKKIKEITKTGSGGTPLSTNKEYYFNGNIPWINSGEVGQSVIRKAEKFITEKGVNNSSATLFPKNSVLVALYGATAGKVSLLDIDATTNQAVCAIYPNNKFSTKFLKYYLDTLYSYLVGISTGSARDNLSQKGIQELEIPFPNLPTQKAIAKVLSDLDTKIELNNRINKELEAMAKTLYDYWFVQFDFPNEKGKPYKSSGGKMVYNEELKREIPVGWKVVKLGSYAEISKGDLITEKEANDGNIKVVAAGLNFSYFHNESNRDKNTITISASGANAGYVNFWREPIFASDCTTVRGKNDTITIMLLQYLRLLQPYISSQAKGSAQPHVYPDDIRYLYFPVPPKHLIEKYDKVVLPANEQIANNHKQNQQLTALRDWLLPMLMNGQVSVKEAEEKLSMAAEQEEEYGKN